MCPIFDKFFVVVFWGFFLAFNLFVDNIYQEFSFSRCQNSRRCQDLLSPRYKKSEKKGKRPAGQTKAQEGTARWWKQGQVSLEEHRDTAQFCKAEVRKAK